MVFYFVVSGAPPVDEAESSPPIRFGRRYARRQVTPGPFFDCVRITWGLELQSLNRSLFFSEIRSDKLLGHTAIS